MKNITITLRKCVAIVLMGMLSIGVFASAADTGLDTLVCVHTEGGDASTCVECIALRAQQSGQQEGGSSQQPADTTQQTPVTTEQAPEIPPTPPTDPAPTQTTPADPTQTTPAQPEVPTDPSAPATLPAEGDETETPEWTPQAIAVVALSCSPAHPKVGEVCEITASLEGVSIDHLPTGGVSFAVGAETIRASVSGSSATITWPAMAAGNVQISARYEAGEGDAYTAGASTSISVTVQEPVESDDPEDDLNTTVPGEPEGEPGDKNLSGAQIDISGGYTYTGDAIEPQYSVSLGGAALSLGTDYVLKSLDGNIEAGQALLTVQGIGEYSGEASQTFTIAPASAADWEVSFSTMSLKASASPDAIQVTSVVDANDNPVDASEYSMMIQGNSASEGTLAAVLTPTMAGSNYTGVNVTSISVLAAPPVIGDAQYEWPYDYRIGADDYYYVSGGVAEPVPVIKATDGTVLVDPTDYTISYANSSNVGGYATATVTGQGSYAGTTYAYNYKPVNQAPGTVTVTVTPTTAVYTGSPITATSIVVENSGTPLVANTDYTVSYMNNTDVGTATIVITGINSFAGIATTETFTITPATGTMTLSNPVVFGGVMTVTANLTGTNLTGKVQFTVTKSDGTTTVITEPVSSNKATCRLYTGSSSVSIVAKYIDDANNSIPDASTSAYNVPRVSLSVTRSSQVGEYALIEVGVTGVGGTPSGTVVLYLDGAEIGRVTLDRYGHASYRLWTPSWGRQYLTAEYLGDGYYVGATSDRVALWDYDKRVPTIRVSTSVGSGSNPTTLTASVTGYTWYDRPTGTVTFYNGSTLLGSATIDRNGDAVYTWRSVPTGTHTIYAVYSGDSQYRSITGTAKITKRASSGSGSGSGSTSSIADPQVPTAGQKVADVLMMDADGKLVTTYDTGTMQIQPGGILKLETTRDADFYSYSVMLQRMKQLSSNAGGYLEIVTPRFTLQLPYALTANLEGLAAALQSAGVSESQAQLHVDIREINDSTLAQSFSTSHSVTATAMYRVELNIYDQAGKKIDYKASVTASPAQFLLPFSGSGVAEGYDETTRTFFPVQASFADGSAILTVSRSGIYIAGQ